MDCGEVRWRTKLKTFQCSSALEKACASRQITRNFSTRPLASNSCARNASKRTYDESSASLVRKSTKIELRFSAVCMAATLRRPLSNVLESSSTCAVPRRWATSSTSGLSREECERNAFMAHLDNRLRHTLRQFKIAPTGTLRERVKRPGAFAKACRRSHWRILNSQTSRIDFRPRRRRRWPRTRQIRRAGLKRLAKAAP
jgi:hypothetical protein